MIKVSFVKKVVRRWYYTGIYMYLAAKRAYILCVNPMQGVGRTLKSKVMDFIIYLVWLLSRFGWRRQRAVLSQYGHSTLGILVRIALCLIICYSIYRVDFLEFSTFIYNQVSNPEASRAGYMIHASIIIIALVWGAQILLLIFSDWYREIMAPYWKEFVMVNLVVLLLLASIHGGVDRAKLGVRVWYTTERFHPMRTHALDYWGTGWVG